MKTFCPQKLDTVTAAGEIVVSMHELDFLVELTGEKEPYYAIEKFACACMNHWKDPQQTLKALNIEAGPVYYQEEGLVLNEQPTYQRVRYELIQRKVDEKS